MDDTQTQNWWQTLCQRIDTTAFRATAVLVTVLALAHALTLILMTEFIMRPQAERLAAIMANNVAAIIEATKHMPPAQQDEFLKKLWNSPYLRIHDTEAEPAQDSEAPSMLETLFMNELAKQMSSNQHFAWKRGLGGHIWIAFDVGVKRVWVSTRPPSSLQPEFAIVLASGFSLALAILAGWALQGWMNKPLQRLNTAAKRLSLSKTDEQVSVEGPLEFRALAQSFNRMIERLGKSERERNLMLAGISHDLRTPLAKIRLAAEMLEDQGSSQDLKSMIVRQIENMDTMLAQFLDFARGLDQEAFAEILPDALIEELCNEGASQGIRFQTRAGVSIHAKPTALRRAVQNLLQNAIKYGRAPIDVSTSVDAGVWQVAVTDSGEGLKGLDQSKAMEPFVRGDEARGGAATGTGLGLAIVAKIAEAHHGSLRLANHNPSGLRATISLPLEKT